MGSSETRGATMKPGSDRPLIELDDVTKVYRLGRVEVRALQDVSLSIREGEMVAVMGRSGSGKSTLMNIIGCLDVPTSGRYLLDAEDVVGMSDDRLAEIRSRKVGFVFQTYSLLPRLTAVDNVALPLMYGDGRDGKTRSAGRAGEGGAGGPRRPSTGRALGWRAAASRDRQGAGQGPGDPAGRRADGQPRQRDRCGDHEHNGRSEPRRGADRGVRDPRARRRPSR